MTTPVDELRTSVLAAAFAATRGGSGRDKARLKPFLDRYYRHLSGEELAAVDPAELGGLASEHLALAARRPVGTSVVRAFNPDPQADGFSGSQTHVLIVTDDMPFIVDSLTFELSRTGRIYRLVHPQFVVARDAAGQLHEVVDVDEVPHGRFGVVKESWIALALDRISDPAGLAELEKRLQTILGDVRDSVEDWPKMRARAQEQATALRSNPPRKVDPQTAAQAADFLDWLADDHFTFLGYREYERRRIDNRTVLRAVPGTGLGTYRYDVATDEALPASAPELKEVADQVILIAKDDAVATVHRSVQQDTIVVRTYDRAGKVVGEKRFVGLYTFSVYSSSVMFIPMVRERVHQVVADLGYTMDSHSGRALVQILESFPREELLQSSAAWLCEITPRILRLRERGGIGVFLRKGVFGRFLSALVYIPRDRFTTQVRLRIAAILQDVTGGTVVDYTTRVNEWSLARLHFSLRLPDGAKARAIDVAALEARIAAATRTWEEDFADAVRARFDETRAAELLDRYARAFPEAYKEDIAAADAVDDVVALDAIHGGEEDRYELYQEQGAPDDERRFKLYRESELSLTAILPMFTHFGVEMTDERPYELDCPDGLQRHIYDVGLRASADLWAKDADVEQRFVDAVAAVAGGAAESDGFNALVLRAGLSWRQVVIVRAMAKFYRQGQATFSQEYVEAALCGNPSIAAMLADLFAVRFDPNAGFATPAARAAAQDKLVAGIVEALDDVASLDQDRILRALLAVIEAATRTNFYQTDADGSPKPWVSIKLEPRRIDFLPMPRPMFEIWVYSPRVEGVHLRFGSVARGGLRWSDRREDFRTEVLGLMKAQTVKNVVIVPTGSKGGFVPKQLPDPAIDRDAWLAEGIASYKVFISGLLDLTDNLVAGEVVPPPDVVRHDGDDPYLVVAADKGTASFSDYANERSQAYGFWLDDAFASGGSAGYDHKGMGITARGAWESVKTHFRELGHDTQTQDFTVVGVGDMSGDVFGNGMLLSEHIKLVAAFDHRHIFVDPDPDPARSYAERRRLFELPRSSWADYDAKLISRGGGVFPRSAKSIPVSAAMVQVLGLPEGTTAMTPVELMRAVLTAPVDLLWNGGIGTYVKSSAENNSQIGDNANNAIRINGNEIRARVVGEGGNLGCSQLGRIEAAENGVRINTDAVDNSAGVDTSDHEVNIKILLGALVQSGDLNRASRDTLLASMTDDVGRHVLRDNYEQNVLLSNARFQARTMLPVHLRLIHQLERDADLDRAIEFLPSAGELARRVAAGEGLRSPEFCVLMAYTKIHVKKALVESALPDDPWLVSALLDYFPPALRTAYPTQIEDHRLRREIVVNSVANSLVNRGGITFMLRAMEETGASVERVARAFVIAREVFGLAEFVAQVEALDNVVPTKVQADIYLAYRRLIDRAARWFLANRPTELDIATEIDRFRDGVARYSYAMDTVLQGVDAARLQRDVADWVAKGVPQRLAQRTSGVLDEFNLLEAIEISQATGTPLEDVVEVQFLVFERLLIDDLLTRVTHLPRDDSWDALARMALRDDLYAVLNQLTRTVLTSNRHQSGDELFAAWVEANREGLSRMKQILQGIERLESPGIAALSVVLRNLRSLGRPGATGE